MALVSTMAFEQFATMRVNDAREVLKRGESLRPEVVSEVCQLATMPCLPAKEFVVEMWNREYRCPGVNSTRRRLVEDCAVFGSSKCHKMLTKGGDAESDAYHTQCAVSGTSAESMLRVDLICGALLLLLVVFDSPLWSLLSFMSRNKEACVVLFATGICAVLQFHSTAVPAPDAVPTGAATSPGALHVDFVDLLRYDNCGVYTLIEQWTGIVVQAFFSLVAMFIAVHIVGTILSPLVSLVQQGLRKVFGNSIIICAAAILVYVFAF